jgi:hypothetical protein
MSTSSSTVSIHEGSIDTIPENASQGLLFLKEFLPILDSLDAQPQIGPFLTPETQFIINRDPPVPVEQLVGMFAIRSKMLQKFNHIVSKAWEIPNERGCTVIFESESVTKYNRDKMELLVAELNIWELIRDGDGVLKLEKEKSFMDPSLVRNRAKELFSRDLHEIKEEDSTAGRMDLDEDTSETVFTLA